MKLKQFRAGLTEDELRQINADAAKRGIQRHEWFDRALRESSSWRRVFKTAVAK